MQIILFLWLRKTIAMSDLINEFKFCGQFKYEYHKPFQKLSTWYLYLLSEGWWKPQNIKAFFF